jgi:hypothetical protein
LAFSWHLSPAFAAGLKRFQGLKALFIQDEYENTWVASRAINDLGIRVVFTCVPEPHVRKVYSLVNADVDFVPVLTGCLPLHLDPRLARRPLRDRRTIIGYRGRELPFQYGKLGREKYVIGREMRRLCTERGVPCDIEWSHEKRIYGDDWVEWVSGCRATLGTESGSNVFDYDGTLDAAIKAALEQDPDLTFEQVFDRFLKDRETEPIMNQVSPRLFEAVALRTGLILFEGRYSDTVRPYEHYIPLKKDFSNVDEVFATVQDDAAMEAMIERAYQHVVGSDRYTYEAFARHCTAALEARVGKPKGITILPLKCSVSLPAGSNWVRLELAGLYHKPVDSRKTAQEIEAQSGDDVVGKSWVRLDPRDLPVGFSDDPNHPDNADPSGPDKFRSTLRWIKRAARRSLRAMLAPVRYVRRRMRKL